MATFYLSYEDGNDANDGTSFANRWKTITSGATAARIAPGDTIRIMGSPAPTSLGINGTWTNGPLPATKSIGSSTNATPIVVTLNSHGYSNGDTLIVNGHTTNTKANGVWEIANVTTNTFELVGSVGNGVGGATGTTRNVNNCRVTLASALTKAIACLGNQGTKTNWTASANVTCSVTTSDFKEGGECQSIDIAAGFATGLAAYLALPLLTDYSAYKQVTFWIKQTAGTVAIAGDISLRLCTDTVGAVSANTIAIPGLTALNRWMPITVDTAAALSALAQSVALYVDTDRGAQTFLIDAVQAVKDSTSADSLSQTSLIGKNTGTETWWGIQSINGTRVMLDRDVNCIPSSAPQRGYYGATETVTAYKRETIKMSPTASDGTMQEAGTAAAVTAYEGGWDRTAMTTQNLETWLDGQGKTAAGINAAVAFNSLHLLNLVRAGGFTFGGADVTSTGSVALNNGSSGMGINGARSSLGDVVAVSGSSNGISFNGNGVRVNSVTSSSHGAQGLTVFSVGVLIGSIYLANNTTIGTTLGARATIGSLTSIDNGTVGIVAAATEGNVILGGSTSGNGSGAITISTGSLFLRNFSIGEASEVSGWTAGANACVFSEKHDGTTDNHQHFHEGGLVSSETSVRHTASGIAWKMSPTSANRNSTYPLPLSLAKIACSAGNLVTVKAWMRRDSTSLTMKLVCKGGQLSGVAADVTASMTAAIDTWEELTITFTPTEAGVIEITAEAYGGTTFSGYVDDMTITQA